MIHADDSVFSLCQDALLQDSTGAPTGTDLDQQIQQVRRLLQALCAIDARYTELGCEFGYIHYKHGEGIPPSGGGKMVLHLPQQGRTRPRRYVGVNPLKQFETRARLARYEARTELRLRFAEMHTKFNDISGTLTSLRAAAAQLQSDAEMYLEQAEASQHDMEKEHERTAAMLRGQ